LLTLSPVTLKQLRLFLKFQVSKPKRISRNNSFVYLFFLLTDSNLRPGAYLKQFVLPSKSNVKFGDLPSSRVSNVQSSIQSKLAKLAVTVLFGIAGGDLSALVRFLYLHNTTFKSSFTDVIADQNKQVTKNLSSLVTSITSVMSHLSPSKPLPLLLKKDSENKKRATSLSGQSHNTQAQNVVLRVVLANSTLKLKYINSNGGNLTQSHFSSLRKECNNIGIVKVLENRQKKRGRKPISETHPGLISNLEEKLSTPDNSSLSNTRKLKRQKKRSVSSFAHFPKQ